MKTRLYLVLFFFNFSFYAQNSSDCWTLIHKGVDIYNGQQGTEFSGFHDPETTDLTEVNNGFLTTGYYNKQSFDSKDGLIYENLKDKAGGYLTKHDFNGSLQWIVYTEKNDNYERDIIHGAVEDSQGNIYAIGHSFNGTLYDSKGTKVDFSNSSHFSYGFIIKLTKDGELIWYSLIDNTYAKKLSLDSDNNILLSGDLSIYNNFTFDYYLNGTITDKLIGFEIMGNDSNYVNRFVLKLNPEGNVIWYTGIKTSGPNSEFLIDIGTDKNNNVYVTGYCSSDAEIYSAGTTEVPNTISWTGYSPKTFLIKFDENGQFLWKVKSLLNDPEINGVRAWSSYVDNDGNTYISGSNDRWRKDVAHIFNNTDGSITSENVGTFFIAKVNTSGICEWIKGAAHSYSGTGYKIIRSGDEIISIGSVRGFGILSNEVDFLSADGNNIRASS